MTASGAGRRVGDGGGAVVKTGGRRIEHRSGQLTLAVVGGVIAVALGGCATPRIPVGDPLVEPVRTEIYERANHAFAHAALLKPAETIPTNSPAFRLAPLILQEVLEEGPGGSDPSITTIYFRQDKVTVKGRLHDRLAYTWSYDMQTEADPGLSVPAQGIRITLDSTGEPAIWEVLADRSGAEILFVSEALEEWATARFKKPLPGRRFVVERELSKAPKALVAQLIPEGPVPMGPIVHLRAGTHDVTAVVCRCMPAQAERLTGQSYYRLVGSDGQAVGLSDSEPASPVAFSLAAGFGLEQRLRLPKRF